MTDDRLLAAKKKFSRLLKEIFQFDCADLDFGIYRILAMRRAELEKFLDDDLLPQVEGILVSAAGDRASVQSELAKLEDQLRGMGVADFATVRTWNELKGKLASSPDVAVLAREVFSDLTTFFARYYDEGDFMALPRYKGDTYAIPYDGSEVKLHWANADQYYIKTTEQHADYTAVVDGVSGLDKPRIRIRLAAAESDRDNNKTSEKRRYVLRATAPVEVAATELTVWFEYRVPEPGNGRQPTQSAICEEAEKVILAALPTTWQTVLTRKSSQSPDKYTVLGYQLYRYTKKNTSDYFIHKDLGGFLGRELDFFIKNEVLFLDDLEGRTTSEIDAALQKVKAVRAVGGKIIDWLAQMENFQKRLWTKKKFVTSTFWLVSSDLVSPEIRSRLLTDVRVNGTWSRIFGDVPKDTVAYQRRMIDTRDLDPDVASALVVGLGDISEIPGGLLVHSENYQALRMLVARYRDGIKAVYIDPPYNTGQDGFLYKDNFRSSTWATMVFDRLRAAGVLMSREGAIFVSIDKNERDGLVWQLRDAFGASNFVEELIWVQDTVSNNAPTYSTNHEYIEVFAKHLPSVEADPGMFRETRPGFREITGLAARLGAEFAHPSSIESGLRELFKAHRDRYREEAARLGLGGEEVDKADPWKGVYPYKHVEYRDANGRLVAFEDARESNARPWVWREVEPSMPSAKQSDTTKDAYSPNYRFYSPPHPVTGRPCKPPKRGWAFPRHAHENRPSYDAYVGDCRICFKDDEASIPQLKYMLHEVETVIATSVIRQYADGEPRLEALFGHKNLIQNPKPPALIERLVRQATTTQSVVLDFFAGSGTTAHAVIDANRADGGCRDFVLVEVGEHFNSVVVPRVMKCALTTEWSDGRPSDFQNPVSLLVKCVVLESYEDTLENISLARSVDAANLFEENASLREKYTLRYMLDLEAESSLLTLERFRKPWDYTIKVRRDGLVQDAPVDLVETFNYLVGLRVKRYDTYGQEGLLFVLGTEPDGRRVIVVWRDCDLWPNDKLEEKCRQAFESFRPNEFDVVYVNGDNHLPIIKTGEESWKVNLIEETFHARMFDTSDVE